MYLCLAIALATTHTQTPLTGRGVEFKSDGESPLSPEVTRIAPDAANMNDLTRERALPDRSYEVTVHKVKLTPTRTAVVSRKRIGEREGG
jgi:hypothetical protein